MTQKKSVNCFFQGSINYLILLQTQCESVLRRLTLS